MKKHDYAQFCVGCGLCSAKCGQEMTTTEKGYLVHANKLSDECIEFCNSCCPSSQNSINKLNTSSIWGFCEEVHIGYSSDEEIRKNASSGGVLSALAIYLLDRGLVDAVIHTGKDDKIPYNTITKISVTRQNVMKNCGSRYAISHSLLDMWEFIEAGKKYCYIGKPCDVTALKNYIEKDEALSEQFPYVFSFFCAGMPSTQANLELLDKLNCKGECVDLTYRGNGWPGFATAVDKNGDEHRLDYATAWGGILGRDINRFCRFCLDGIGERADISCGDAWYLLSDGNPDFSEHAGRNIIFTRNAKGSALLQDAVREGYIIVEAVEDAENYLKQIQKYQFIRKSTMRVKLLACRLFGMSIPYSSQGVVKEFAKYAHAKDKYVIFKGTIKRILTKKI